MAIISSGFVSRTRERGLIKTLALTLDSVLVSPFHRTYHALRTRNAPEYANPSETELLEIEEGLRSLGVSVEPLLISPDAFADFRVRFRFPSVYHGGPDGGVYDEKLLEHFIAYTLCHLERFGPNDVYVDVAASGSPWARILRDSGINAVAIDLKLNPQYKNLDYYRLMDATRTSFQDSSVRAMSLQCAYEMFCGDDDWKFLDECSRVLKPGGTVVISPLYMHTHHCGYSSPEYWRQGYADVDAAEYVRRNTSGIPFSRKYSATLLKHRVLDRLSRLGMTYNLYRLDNKSDLGNSIYCHFVLELTKQ